MFTGLVEELGIVEEVSEESAGIVLRIAASEIGSGTNIGDSICINGCCLTVIAKSGELMSFEAGPETLRCTNLGELGAGTRVNLERALKISTALGGHFVSGHIDGTGIVTQRKDDERWSEFWIDVPAELTRQMASKGSVAVDGISLTLGQVTNDAFCVYLIPHTLQVTTMSSRQMGDTVNIETDILAKYVERQLMFKQIGPEPNH